MQDEFVYKIRRKSDGLFSSGGSSPTFTKKGKVWRDRASLDKHLGMILQYPDRSWGWPKYEDCEVVVFIIGVTDREDIQKYANVILERKADRKRKAKEEQEERARARRRETYNVLKKEFENG